MPSADRILTTHVGSLPRPPTLLDLMQPRLAGAPYDSAAYQRQIRDAVAGVVARQIEAGVDVVTDGEMSKPSFFTYVNERLDGFEPRPDETYKAFAAEVAAFPEYYEDYFQRSVLGGAVAPIHPTACVGPVSYKGHDALAADLDNLKAALAGHEYHAAFVPAVAPSGVGGNEFYATDEEFFHAVGAALRHEYLAIVEAGFQVQIDDPFLTQIFNDPTLDESGRRKKADMYVEAINHSIEGIAQEKVRFHTCYGINEGPRIHDAPLADVAGHMLRVNAGAYSFEAANPRHEHEYKVWETVKLPDGKAIIPGVITHASNIVEHPELIAEWLIRFANLVGRDNVIAGADCGFSSLACYHTEVHPTVIWAKFEAMVEGARIASRALW